MPEYVYISFWAYRSLIAWRTVHCQRRRLGFARGDIPAGSLRCERLVRSSLASSMAGFISGGRFGSLPSWMASSVVSTVFVCGVDSQPMRSVGVDAALQHYSIAGRHTSPVSRVKTSVTLSPATCLSVTSEATQPSAVSGCQARVPTSKMCAMVCVSGGQSSQSSQSQWQW